MKNKTNQKRWHRILAGVLTVGIGVGTLSACGGAPQQSTTAAASETVSEDGRRMKGNLYLEGLPIVKEKETYKIAVLKHPLDTGTFADKYIVKRLEEETNIHIEWLEIPNTDFPNKVNLMFATGEMPDMIMGGISGSTISKNKSSLIKLDEYMEEYAPNIYKMYYEDDPEIAKELTHTDGHIYSFETNCATQPANATAGVFWYHKKMFEDTGLPFPTTVDEYYEVLKKIKEQNPSAIPLTSCENIWSTKFNQLTGPWGILSTNVTPGIDENGKVYSPVITDEFYEALKYYHKLSKEGLYDPEAFGQTIEQARAKGSQGLVASFVAWNPNEIVGATLKDEYDYFKEPLKGPDGTQLWHGENNKRAGWREGAIMTTNCKSPETLMRWMDYMNSSLELKLSWQFGENGKDFILDEATGKWHKTTPEEHKEMGYVQPEGAQWTLAYGDHAPIFLTLEDMANQDESFNNEDGKKRNAAVDAMRPFFPKKQQFFPRIYEDDAVIDARANIQVELEAYLKEFIATSIVNGIDDAKWANHLEQMKKLKIDEYIESYQKMYDSAK